MSGSRCPVPALVLACLAAGAVAQAQHVYWYDVDREAIKRASLDGSPPELVVREALASPVDLALGGGKLYWRDATWLARSDAGGTSLEILFEGATRRSSSGPAPSSIALDLDGGKVYWTELDGIRRADLDGANPESILSGIARPTSPVLDAAGGKLYWFSSAWIRRADLDGSGVEDLVNVGRSGLHHRLALDAAGGKMYWTTGAGVGRADLDGSNVESLWTLSPSAGFGLALALDLSAGRLYFAGRITPSTIRRADLDGSNAEDLVAVDGLRSLVLDSGSGWIYWASDAGTVRAHLDGSGVESLVAEPSDRLVLDPAEGRLYWSDDGSAPATAGPRIRRSSLDGTGIENVHTPLLGVVRDIEIGARSEWLYWVDGQRIRKAGLDGSGIADVLTVGPSSFPEHLAVDSVAGKVYWTDRSLTDEESAIRRANLDGSEVESLVAFPPGEQHPGAIDLDPARGHLYWVQKSTFLGREARLQRADLDGSDVTDVIGPGAFNSLEPFVLDPIDGRLYVTLCEEPVPCLRSGASFASGVVRATLAGSDAEVLGIGAVRGLDLDAARRGLYWVQSSTTAPATVDAAALDGTQRRLVVDAPGNAHHLAVSPASRPLTATGRAALKDGPGWRADTLIDVLDTVPAAVGVGSIGTLSGVAKDVAVDPVSGDVFTIGLVPGPDGQRLYRVDPVTGAGAALPGPTGLPPPAVISGLAFDARGNLYGGGLGIYWIDTDTGRAYPLKGLLDVPGAVFGLARSPLGLGFFSTGVLVTRGGLVPYLALHDPGGALVPGAVVPVVDGSGRRRLLLDIAVTENGLLLGTALEARLGTAGFRGSQADASRLIDEALGPRQGLRAEWLRERAESAWSGLAGLSLELSSDLVLIEGAEVAGLPVARLGEGAPLSALLLGLGPPAGRKPAP